jgi:hypothetical protein
MLDKYNRAFEVNHQRQHGGNWRIRRIEEHPNDPGWEKGTYCYCHDSFRRKANAGDLMFDTVYPEGCIDNDPIVRSVIPIKKVSGLNLSFSEFLFLDGPTSEGVAGTTRNYKQLDREEAEAYLEAIESAGEYGHYDVGDRPASITSDEWEQMLAAAGTDQTCSSDSSADPGVCPSSDSDC